MTIIFNLLLFYLLFIILYRAIVLLLKFSLKFNATGTNRRKTGFYSHGKPRQEKEIIDADFEEIE